MTSFDSDDDDDQLNTLLETRGLKKTSSHVKKSAFVIQLNFLLEKPHNGPCGCLLLSFVDCTLHLSDVKELDRRIPLLNRPPDDSTRLGLSFERCRLACPKALELLQYFIACRDVQSLGFSASEFQPEEIQLLVQSAYRLSSLELSLRYQPGLLPPLLEVCSLTLETLTLNAKFPLEHRVRAVCVRELTTSMVSLKLKSFALTDCSLDDEGLALLTGGLLALKNTLVELNVQTDGGNAGGLSYQSLPLLGCLLTDLPKLDTFRLELSDCKRLLHELMHAKLQSFCADLQMTLAANVYLNWSHVGWYEEAVLQMLQAAAGTPAKLSLHISDSTPFVENERFVYQLATYLPQVSATDLSIVASDDERDFDWWNDNKQDLLVEALSQNASLQNLKLQLGHLAFTKHHQDVLDAILERNRQKRKESNDDKKEGSFPSAAVAMHLKWMEQKCVILL